MMKTIFSILLSVFLFSTYSQPQDLPPFNLEYASYAVSDDGSVIGYYGVKRRVEVKSFSEISRYVQWCLIATEDRDFYEHDGVSYKGLVRGILKTITGETQGGSTITMQLARNLFLNHERTVGRKINEIDLAKKLEQRYTKDQILLLYLNTVYFGKGAHGIWAASQEYFSKTPDRLSISESAVLVGLLQSPAGYDPQKNPGKLLNRRNEVLHNLVETGKLSEKEYQKLRKSPLNLKLRGNPGRHFLEHVRKEAVLIVNEKGYKLSEDQLKITTTLDSKLQEITENNIEEQWKSMPKDLQIGIVSIEPSTGFIKAMIGGNPDSESKGLNRSTQIKRQPGSSFKPFLYGSLIKDGYTLATPLLDSAMIVNPGLPTEWRPSNSSNTFSGNYIPLINAVQNSVNLAAAYAITRVTTPEIVASFAHLCGINSYIPSYPSIALGTAEVSPIEMASAYSVFASYGYYNKPVAILKIEDQNGQILYDPWIESKKVLDSADSYLITKALESVVDAGTGSSIRRFYKGFAAGKTGTTQNSTDVWFVGYTTILSTAIWMGYDSSKKKLSGTYEYGGTACAPLWGKIMQSYYAIKAGLRLPYHQPSSVQNLELCTETGQRAYHSCSSIKIYPVNIDNLPPICHKHSPVEKFDIHYSF
jgi:membrane peptidoglycan carboxypeptidase